MHLHPISNQNILSEQELSLHKLHEYEVLNTPAEKSFDHFAQMAADIFEVPHAAIGFFASQATFFKALIGKQLVASQNEKLSKLFAETDEVLTLEQAPAALHVSSKFFAGSAIKSPEGYTIGAIMVFDESEHTATKKQLVMLKRLAEMVMENMEVRRAIRKTLRAQDDRLHVLIHDLKNPMTTISLQSELVSRMPDVDERAATIAKKINHQSKRMVEQLNEILSSARKENGSFKPQKAKIDLRSLLINLTVSPGFPLNSKKQTLQLDINHPLEIFADEDKIKALFFQLLQNASKFSDEETKIVISHEMEDNLVTIAIKDNGVGLTSDDLKRLFIKFANLSAAPTHHENSNGLGLIIAKMFTDMHKGKIWATSEGLTKGTTFYVTLPVK